MIAGRSKKRIHEGVSQLKRARLHLRFFTNDISERTAEIEAETKVRQRLQKCRSQQHIAIVMVPSDGFNYHCLDIFECDEDYFFAHNFGLG
jgi:hypothetical protein